MRLPRPPDWLIYFGLVLVLLGVALGQQERADAPEAPPPMPGEAGMPLAAYLPFDPSRVVKLTPPVARYSGTAFSVADSGVWLTAGHVLEGCLQAAVVVAEGRGVAAKVMIDRKVDIAVLRTQGGSPALPLLPPGQTTKAGGRGFHPGFPQGVPGEVTSLLLGPETLRGVGRGQPARQVLAWSEVGRTDGLKGMLNGLSGAPVLDNAGRVVGLTLAEAPRRGRLYAATPEAIRQALVFAGAAPGGFAPGQPINTDNYGRAGDALRRDVRVARVVCLAA